MQTTSATIALPARLQNFIDEIERCNLWGKQSEVKTLAERAEAVTVDDIDANPAEFFGVLVGKGLNSNRTSL